MDRVANRFRPRLSLVVTAAIVVGLLAILPPGMLWVKSTLENRLVADRLQVLERVTRDWAARLDEQFLAAEQSISRFAALLSRAPVPPARELSPRFDRIVARDADGAWRSDRKHFRADREAGIWLQQGHPLTDARKRFFMQAKEITEVFGAGALGTFVDTWVLPREGGIVIFWPAQPEWIYGATADLDYTETPWVTLTGPEGNPTGVPCWTPTSFDPAPQVWMISVVAPFRRNGAWAGAVGHDLPISGLMQKIGDVLVCPGSSYMLVRRDGTLLLSSRFHDRILETGGNVTIADTGDRAAARWFRSLHERPGPAGKSALLRDRETGRIIIAAHIQAPDWHLITVVPEAALLQSVRSAYGPLWLVAGLVLAVLALLPAIVISRSFIPAVGRILRGTRAVAAGDLEYRFPPEATREFNTIAESFNRMVQAWQEAQQSLRRSETRYRGLVANIPGAIYRCNCDADWTMHVISDEIERISGYPAADFIENRVRSYASIMHPEDRAAVQQSVLAGVRERQPFILEYRVVDSRGHTRWVHEKGQGVFGTGGELLWLDGAIFDVTERKAVEEHLQRNRYYLEKAQELGRIGTWDLDFVSNRLVWTDECCRIFGVPAGTVLDYDTFLEKVHPEDRDCVQRSWRAALTGRPYDIEHRILVAGRVKWVREKAEVAFDGQGQPVSAIGVAQDITERKKVEEEKNRLLSAIEQTNDSVIITDETGIILFANRASQGMTGFRNADLLGSNLFSPRQSAYDEAFYRNLWQTVSSGRVWKDFMKHRHADGTLCEFASVVTPISSAAGEIVNYVAVSRDITREVQLEQKLQQSQRLESIGTLAAGIAHDFNNILAAIIGNVDMLLEDLPAGGEPRACARQIHEAADRARRLVGQILAFGRRAPQRTHPFSMESLIRESVGMLRSTIPATIEIETRIDCPRDIVTGDETQIQQVFMNLCVNAEQAMHASGGMLRVGLSNRPLGEPDLSLCGDLEPGEYLQLIVRDTGHGIPADVLERVFDPFFTTKETGKGTGLGLSVAHGIVRNHGGAIRVASVPGEGTTVTVLLPVTAGGTAEAAPVVEAAAPRGAGHVLLLDDESMILRVGTRVLESLGYTVSPFQDAGAALAAFRSDPQGFDVIVSDMTMPRMTGAAFAGEVLHIRPGTPFVLCTGYSDLMSERECARLGIRAFLTKPYSKQDIARTLRNLLEP